MAKDSFTPAKACPFCGSLRWRLEIDVDVMWVQCDACLARGPTIGRVGSLSVLDQQNRVKDRFFITEIVRPR